MSSSPPAPDGGPEPAPSLASLSLSAQSSGGGGGSGGGEGGGGAAAPELPLPAVGARVRCEGLTGAAELNGCLGRVVSHEGARARVLMDGPSGRVVGVKPRNLVVGVGLLDLLAVPDLFSPRRVPGGAGSLLCGAGSLLCGARRRKRRGVCAPPCRLLDAPSGVCAPPCRLCSSGLWLEGL